MLQRTRRTPAVGWHKNTPTFDKRRYSPPTGTSSHSWTTDSIQWQTAPYKRLLAGGNGYERVLAALVTSHPRVFCGTHKRIFVCVRCISGFHAEEIWLGLGPMNRWMTVSFTLARTHTRASLMCPLCVPFGLVLVCCVSVSGS